MRTHAAVVLFLASATAVPAHATRGTAPAQSAAPASKSSAPAKPAAEPKGTTASPKASREAEKLSHAKPEPAAEARPGLLRRAIAGVGHAFVKLGSVIGNPFKTSDAVKKALAEATSLRKEGKLSQAATELFDAPRKGITLVDHFRLWRANRALFNASRKAVSGKSLLASPQVGLDALKVMGENHKLSSRDNKKIELAKHNSAANAVETARTLLDRGELVEAAKMLEWTGRQEEAPALKEDLVRVRLNNQLVETARIAGHKYKSLPKGKEKDALAQEIVKEVRTALQIDAMAKPVEGPLGEMLEARSTNPAIVASAMGISIKQLNDMLKGSHKPQHKPQPKDTKAAKGDKTPAADSDKKLPTDTEKKPAVEAATQPETTKAANAS